jgi:pimeloyl-ACP methyl ester carboxylesterase
MSKKIKFDAGRLAVATGGAGDPAVFVHGFSSSMMVWKKVCRGLKDVLSYYAIDLPGSGESPAPRGFRYSLENFADVLTDFIIMKNLKALTLVGSSLGATVILEALLRNRDELTPRVRSLCLIGAAAYPPGNPFLVEALQIPVLGPLAAHVLLPFHARRGTREALINTTRLINVERLARYGPHFKTIDLPTLVIWGRNDRIIPLQDGRRLARDLPNSQLIVIDRCGHSPHAERPAKVIAALREFIRKTGGNTSSIAAHSD